MRRLRKIVLYVLGGAVLAVTLAACGWLYATQNVETPSYAVERADGDIEIRAYPELIVAQVTRTGKRWKAVNAGFGPLAGYIFAREREGDKISMTAPVTQRADAPGGAWTVQFIMPSQYSLSDLPAPARADVTLGSLPPTRRAAIRFSGVATDELIAEQEGLLRAWLDGQGLVPVGPPTYAYYNDPFTPGFLRRNEVLFDLDG